MTAETLENILFPEHLRNVGKDPKEYTTIVTQGYKSPVTNFPRLVFLIKKELLEKSKSDIGKFSRSKLNYAAEIIYDLDAKVFVKNRWHSRELKLSGLKLSNTVRKLYL